MKPIKLVMQAFGSYGERTTIDFEKPNQNIFLITGDTGAGKTTIFDALVFALYGEASSSSNKKEGIVLQSQYVSLDVEPFVELTFCEECGGVTDIYKVRRVPRHLRMKKRKTDKGGETKEVSGSVTLTMPDETEYPQKEADKKLMELVGLTKEQFMQVVMIAQGEFMELLRAKSDDKKKIFRKLFHTELYENIVNELYRRKKEKESDIGKIRTQCQTEAAHILIPQEYERAQAMSELKHQVEKGVIVVMPMLLEELKTLCLYLQDKEKEGKKEEIKLSRIRDEKKTAYDKAESLMRLYQQLEDATRELELCQMEEALMEEKAKQILLIRASYEIKEKYARYKDANQHLKRTQDALLEQKERLPLLKKQEEEQQKVLELQKEKLDQASEAYSAAAQRVKAAKEIFEKIALARRSCENLKTIYEHAKENVQKKKIQLADLEEKEIQWRKQVDTLQNMEPLLVEHRSAWNEAESLLKSADDAIRQQKEVYNQQKVAKEAAKAYGIARESYLTKKQSYDELRQAFLDAQAGFLAKELKEGSPCPVCGSLEHPAPHPWNEFHENLSKDRLDLLGREVEQLSNALEKKAQASSEANALLEAGKKTAQTSVDDLLHRLKGGHVHVFTDAANEEVSLAEIRTKILLWKEHTKEEISVCERKIQLLTQLRTKLKDAETEKMQLKEDAEQAVEAQTNAHGALEHGLATLKTLMETTSEFKTEKEAADTLKRFDQEKRCQMEAYEQADRKAKAAVLSKEKAEHLVKTYQETLPELKDACEHHKAAYEETMQQKDIAEEEWMQAVSKYHRTADKELQDAIDLYNRKKQTAQNKYAFAKEHIGDQAKPVLEDAKQQLLEAQTAFDQAKEVLAYYSKYLADNKRAYEDLAPRMERRQKVVEEHTKLENLYKLVSGNVTDSRMDLETFVLRYYLERILFAANRRFQEMSAGQFELRMVEEAQAGKGKNRGLDLMVYSTVTGKEREVRTLSGGESFMAALSLALGMADQIQESASAIHLDMMFIDEGFGSLDDHSRNQAVRVLQQMAGTNRLIGIISHVTELKQEMDNQLIVRKDENGSHVRWEIS